MKTAIFVLALSAVSVAAWSGCKSDDTSTTNTSDAGSSGSSGVEGHTSQYPDCQIIIDKCHPKDVGDGPAHDCHDLAHDAKSNADCTAKKASCITTCDAVDAGEEHEEDGGHEHDGG